MSEIKVVPTLLNGSPIPNILYGTARRQQKPPPEVLTALQTGYRAVDTASTRRYHWESEDGKAIADFLRPKNGISRQDIFIQSKFSSPTVQGEPWPYEIADSIMARVFKSVLRSTADLGVDTIDVYFLHEPLKTAEETLEAWQALEQIVEHSGIRYLGIANVGISSLEQLFRSAKIKPDFVQNWFRQGNGFDREVVAFCKEHDIAYQAFGIFDEENAHLLSCEPVVRLVKKQCITRHQALLQILIQAAASQGLRLHVLDGTTNQSHMRENLSVATCYSGFNDTDVESFKILINWA